MTDPITIDSVEHFVSLVAQEMEHTHENVDVNVSSGTFYRGQADSSWTISPSLYRSGLFSQERSLISEIQRVCPDEFGSASQFDKLVKMQHYGLPTRLLDITTNPLIALHFACDNIAGDGSVFTFQNMPVFSQHNAALRLLMLYLFEFSDRSLDLESFCEMALKDPVIAARLPALDQLRDFTLHYLTRVPIMAVRPSLSSRRIVQQDGAFLVFGMVLDDGGVNRDDTAGRARLELLPLPAARHPENLWHASSEYRIPAEKKALMRRTLSRLGITRRHLFPELEHQVAFVREAAFAQLHGSNKAREDDVQ